LALFGQNRTAVLRMAGLPLQKECEKDWKMRCAQAKEHEKKGRKVPSGFITPQWFFTVQYNRAGGAVRRSETFIIPIVSCLQGTILAPTPARLPTAGSVAHGH
jgi:hypothetical protein